MRHFGRMAVGCCLMVLSVAVAEPVKSQKSEISQLMKKTFLTPGNRGTNKNLDSKLILGRATEVEQQELLRLLEQLAQAKPPRGDLEAWKTRTQELQNAAKAVIKGEEKAVERFKKASNCRDCHMLHRPEK